MDEGLHEAFIGIFQAGIFPDNCNGDFMPGFLYFPDDVLPEREIRLFAVQVEFLADEVVEPFIVQHQRHFIDRFDILGGDDGVDIEVAVDCDLLFHLGGKGPFCPA